MLKPVTAALLATLCLALPARAEPNIPVRASFVPAAPALAAWVAQDRGFFAQQGLNVSLTPVQNVSLVPGLLGNQIDIGMVTTVDLIKAADGGLNIAAIAGNHMEVAGSTTNVLVARKDSGIRSIHDLAGRIVGTPSVGAILHVALLHWMVKEGMNPNSIQAVEIPFPLMADQMAAGRIDVAVSAQPFAARMLAAGNISLGNQLLQVADPVSATLWIADRTWAASHRAAVAKWTAALNQSRDFIAHDPAAAREILVKWTKLPPQVVQNLPMPDFETKLSAADIDVWIKVLGELHQLQGHPQATQLIATAP